MDQQIDIKYETAVGFASHIMIEAGYAAPYPVEGIEAMPRWQLYKLMESWGLVWDGNDWIEAAALRN